MEKERVSRNWRQSYQEMFRWHMDVLAGQPNMRVDFEMETTRVGDMDREDRIAYAWLQAEKDVNRAIHDYNRNELVEKSRSGEAA